ncbi:hypothetical protein TNCV_3786511 [Trichonephila clavipes]|nr:hypothetical protein TNCV_3786511 [Trichonephila clavipes]
MGFSHSADCQVMKGGLHRKAVGGRGVVLVYILAADSGVVMISYGRVKVMISSSRTFTEDSLKGKARDDQRLAKKVLLE